jgi:hypothetical protein
MAGIVDDVVGIEGRESISGKKENHRGGRPGGGESCVQVDERHRRESWDLSWSGITTSPALSTRRYDGPSPIGDSRSVERSPGYPTNPTLTHCL